MKRILMAALCLSCVTLGSHAIDINIPGADPTISKDAYQNYRKAGNEVQKTENIIANQIRDEYNNNGSKKWTLDELLYFTKELYHSTNQSSSVFILKDNGANIKFTVPESSQFGKTIKGDPLTTDVQKGNFRLIEGNIHYTVRKSGESQVKENLFSYPTVRNATREIRQTKSGALEGAINFGVKYDPSLSYHISYDLIKKKELELLKTHDQQLSLQNKYFQKQNR